MTLPEEDDNELLTLVASTYEPLQILDILGMDTIELVRALEEKVLDNLYLFKEIEDYDNT